MVVAGQYGVMYFFFASVVASILLLWRVLSAGMHISRTFSLIDMSSVSGGAGVRTLANLGLGAATGSASFAAGAAASLGDAAGRIVTNGAVAGTAGGLLAAGYYNQSLAKKATSPERQQQAAQRARQLQAAAGYVAGKHSRLDRAIEGVHEARSLVRNFKGTEQDADAFDYLRLGQMQSHGRSNPWLSIGMSPELQDAYKTLGRKKTDGGGNPSEPMAQTRPSRNDQPSHQSRAATRSPQTPENVSEDEDAAGSPQSGSPLVIPIIDPAILQQFTQLSGVDSAETAPPIATTTLSIDQPQSTSSYGAVQITSEADRADALQQLAYQIRPSATDAERQLSRQIAPRLMDAADTQHFEQLIDRVGYNPVRDAVSQIHHTASAYQNNDNQSARRIAASFAKEGSIGISDVQAELAESSLLASEIQQLSSTLLQPRVALTRRELTAAIANTVWQPEACEDALAELLQVQAFGSQTARIRETATAIAGSGLTETQTDAKRNAATNANNNINADAYAITNGDPITDDNAVAKRHTVPNTNTYAPSHLDAITNCAPCCNCDTDCLSRFGRT